MSVAAKVSVGYFVAGVLYIVLSDVWMGFHHDNITTPLILSGILKGSVFFLVTAVILYFVLQKYLHQMNERRHLLNTIVNNTNDLLWLIDSNFNILLANKAFTQTFTESSDKSLSGINVLDLARASDERQKWKSYYQHSFNGNEVHIDEGFKDHKGEQVFVQFHLFPVTDRKGNITMVTCFGQDITGLKKIQFEIEEQNRALKEITWIQAHEFRKPVANIMGLVDALDTAHPEHPENSEIMEHVRAQAEELDQVIRRVVARASKVK